MNGWLLLVYKVPRQPTATRVYVWRKLKQLGAILLHDAVWVIPSNPRTQEQCQWLVDEILELDGEAMLWKAEALLGGQVETLIGQFQDRATSGYQEILTALKSRNADFAELSRRYRQIREQDFFPGKFSNQVEKALLSAQRRSKP